MAQPLFCYIKHMHMATRVVHCKREKYDIYIGRPSKWANPYSHKSSKYPDVILVKTRQEAIDCYREYITNGAGRHLLKDLNELKDKVLGCWCKPKACHGDVLAELVELYCN